MTMHIGYVVKRYPRYSETFIVNEILAHEAAGCEITIYALLPPEDTHFQEIISRVRAPVHYLPYKTSKASELWDVINNDICGERMNYAAVENAGNLTAREAVQGFTLARYIREHGVTHLHAHFATAATVVAKLAGDLSQTPYSLTAHAKDIFHQDVVGAELVAKFRTAKFVVTVSDFNVEYLTQRLGTNATESLFRVYNGLDLAEFPFIEYGARAPLIVAVGRLVEKKGFSDLISACALLKHEGVRFECQIVGTGPEEEALRAQIRGLNLADVVELAGPMPRSRVKELLTRAAVFAAPCVVGADGNRDGLPTVLIEAMASGTPCVSTDVTAIREVIRDRETGLLIDPGDVRALQARITDLLSHPGLCRNMALAARRVIERDFDIHRNTVELRGLFEPAADQQSWSMVAR